jgi:hypothetical protein
MIDVPYAGIADPEGYRRERTRTKILSAFGTWVIHPGSIEIGIGSPHGSVLPAACGQGCGRPDVTSGST